jgi:predicted CXXCH cytochrome family protein
MDLYTGHKIKRILFSGLTLIVLIFLIKLSFASTDPPHIQTPNGVSCFTCHTMHNAPGSSLTSTNSNENLCLSCHKVGSPASAKPFTTGENTNVIPGISGRHHRWDGVMPATSSPSNSYGLRPVSELSNKDLRIKLADQGNVVTCSACHNQHNQGAEPWDPDAPTPYTEGSGSGRHFMRTEFLCVKAGQDCSTNEINDLCQDCHYYRAMTYTRADGEDLSYPANGTNVFSHSVGDPLNYRGYDKAAPLDFDGGAQQGSPRYKNNSSSEPSSSVGANKTNNIVLDYFRKVRCLSCHRIHYVDSNGLTVDAP